MSTNERMSKVEIPAWWLAKAIPLLKSRSTKLAEVAREASAHAGRGNAWDSSAISKFMSPGTGRTVALTNGISAALQIPPPFFVAPTERAASEMHQVMKREQARSGEAVDALSALDGVAARENYGARLDAKKNRAVVSSDNGAKSGRGARAERASKGRS
jgi:hypothetical protein